MTEKPILIVKLGSTFPQVIKDYGDFPDLIQEQVKSCDVPVTIVDPVRGESLPHPGEFAGIILTGSHAMVTDHHSWSERTAKWLPLALNNRVPVLGVCYGHQLLAYACGGVAGPNPNGTEIGTFEIRLKPAATEDSLFQKMPPTFLAHTTHAQSVLKLPKNAVSLAASDLEPHQAFFLPPCAWGVQFHPEFNTGIVPHYIAAFENELRAEKQTIDALLKHIKKTPVSRSLLFNFGELCKLCTPQ